MLVAPPTNEVRGRETRRAALLSVASNTVLTLSKLTTGYLTGSISVLSEGLHSGNDLVAALLAYFSVRKANEPADEQHGYGHGKFEAVSGAIEALLIVGAALAILYAAAHSLISGNFETLDHEPALAVMGLSLVVNTVVSRYLYRVAARHDSLALRADAAHLSTDVWTSAAVFVGLGIIFVAERLGREAHWIDPALAILVALLVSSQGWRIARDALDQLTDRRLPDSEIERIVRTMAEHENLFVGFHKLRSRQAGSERHVDLHLVVCDHMTVRDAHGLANHLEEEIARLFPRAEVMIHIEPCRDEQCQMQRQDETWERCAQQCRRARALQAEQATTAGVANS